MRKTVGMKLFTAKLPAKSLSLAGIADNSYDNREDDPDKSLVLILSRLLKPPLAQTSTQIMNEQDKHYMTASPGLSQWCVCRASRTEL